MRNKYLLLPLAVLLLLQACSKEEPEAPEATAAMEFRIATRVGDGTLPPDDKKQRVRLYIGVNAKEEAGIGDDQTHLHLYDKMDLGSGSSFQLLLLTEQRYKMAFVCVPRLDGMFAADQTIKAYAHDYNAQVIDYSPVLAAQPDPALAETGHIYRKVISRHAASGQKLTEDVTLVRLNGQLVLDMGVLEDQFEKTVTKIEVVLNDIPKRLYVRDNDTDELIPEEPAAGQTIFTSTPTAGGQAQTHHRIVLNLLPAPLEGVVRIYEEGKEPAEYPIKGASGDGKIEIKRNTRTTLEFNGLPGDSFTVKYAGFEGSSIGVDGDEWDGWEEIN